MGTRLTVAVLLNTLMVLSAHAADDAGTNSSPFREWIYPDSYVVQVGATGAHSSGEPVGETGQFTTEDSIQKVVRFYAKKAGIEPSARPVDLKLADGKPARDAGIVEIRVNDDAPSVMLLRNAGDNTTAVTLLFWSPGEEHKLVATITRGKDDTRTLIQLLLHRRE